MAVTMGSGKEKAFLIRNAVYSDMRDPASCLSEEVVRPEATVTCAEEVAHNGLWEDAFWAVSLAQEFPVSHSSLAEPVDARLADADRAQTP